MKLILKKYKESSEVILVDNNNPQPIQTRTDESFDKLFQLIILKSNKVLIFKPIVMR